MPDIPMFQGWRISDLPTVVSSSDALISDNEKKLPSLVCVIARPDPLLCALLCGQRTSRRLGRKKIAVNIYSAKLHD